MNEEEHSDIPGLREDIYIYKKKGERGGILTDIRGLR